MTAKAGASSLETAPASSSPAAAAASPRFIVALYGARHAGLLLTHLYSIRQTHPRAAVSVYWQDLPPNLFAALQALFPSFDFVRTGFDFHADPLRRISSKVLSWCRAVEEHAGEPRLCLADADTLVRRDLTHFYDEIDADVIFTHHPNSATNRDRAPVNSGVMLARGGPAAVKFFQRWRDETLHVLDTPELFALANDYSKPYAGPDQLSLHRLIAYRPEQERYELGGAGPLVRIAAAPCQQLNEMNSRPVEPEIHIVHYKGGWQPILLEGRPFSRFRPRTLSWDMFVLFFSRFQEALAALNAAAGSHFTAADLGIVIPWHFDPSGRFHPLRYRLWQARDFAGRVQGFLRRRLLPAR